MEYLKLFDTEDNYLAYRDDKSKYLKPNLSLSEEDKTVYYNYPPKPKANGHDYVDLGLPSGTLWATMNVGASKPSDYGLYFQCGDTSGYTTEQIGTGDGKKQFTWKDYKFSIDGSASNFSKYTTTGATLDLEDDAAHVNMGGDWHMPSHEQIQELINETTNTWTTQNNINGRLFTSKTDPSKTIFIPAAGNVSGGSINLSGRYGGIWSSVLDEDFINSGNVLSVTSGHAGLYDGFRNYGFSVRGVLG